MRCLVTLLLLIASSCATVCDIHIRGGLVVDGTGSPPRRADVLIRGDRILAIGSPTAVQAERTIDASGKIVTPGFIDPHAHGDPRRTPGFRNFLAMGVTTICLGQDGSSPAGAGRDFRAWLDVIDRGTPGCHIVPFVGHGTLRTTAGIALGTPPTDAQLARLEELVAAAMQAGAFGVSMGLEYTPGRFATAPELARVFDATAKYGGVVMAHVRNEDDDAIEAALREFVAACPENGRAHVAHLKVVHGRGEGRADEILALLEELRRDRRVTADVYPYVASYTGIGIVFPAWAKPPHDYAAVVASRRDDLAAALRAKVTARNGPGALLFGSGEFGGRTLADVAADAGRPFEDVLIDLGPSGPGAAHFVMDRALMERLLTAEHVVVSSDGSPTMRHPRGHGAFARVLRRLVRDRELLPIEHAIHKMTGATAAIVGLPHRGVLAAGNVADVLVFDPNAVEDRATFENPFQRASGIDTVIVAGVVARAAGEFGEQNAGRLLRRTAPAR